MKNIKIIGIIIIIAAVLAAVSVFIYKDFNVIEQDDTKKNNMENSTENSIENNIENNMENDSQAGRQTGALNPEEIKAKMPDLSKPIKVYAELPEEIKNKAVAEIKILSQSLKEDYDTLEGWIQLGLLKKFVNDYEGAREAWEFAALIRPKSAIPFHNLGFLHWQYIKDVSASEKNYLKALENDPKDINAYVDLSNVYYFNFKDAEKAEEILLKGLEENPNNQALLGALGELKAREQ